MSQVQDIFPCPKCGSECVYEIDVRTREEWCCCLNPDCDYGWKYERNPETGELEEVAGKVAFYRAPSSELRPLEDLPIQIAADDLLSRLPPEEAEAIREILRKGVKK